MKKVKTTKITKITYEQLKNARACYLLNECHAANQRARTAYDKATETAARAYDETRAVVFVRAARGR